MNKPEDELKIYDQLCPIHRAIDDVRSELLGAMPVVTRRYQVLHVILQEGPPSLRWRLPVTDHVFAHTGLADSIIIKG